MELIDYIETAAKENAAFHLSNADSLAKESNTLMNMLFVGAGGALTYFVALSDKGAALWVKIGVASVAVYLFCIAGLLLYKCLRVRPMFPSSNEPKNLSANGFPLDTIRSAELKNKQASIDANRDRNASVGIWLNRCRALAMATSVLFAVAVLGVFLLDLCDQAMA